MWQDSVEILEWLRSGPDPCPWDANTGERAVAWQRWDSVLWMLQHGYNPEFLFPHIQVADVREDVRDWIAHNYVEA